MHSQIFVLVHMVFCKEDTCIHPPPPQKKPHLTDFSLNWGFHELFLEYC